jgi:hypothetical protein
MTIVLVATKEQTMTKRIALEFSEGNEVDFERELSVTESQSLGLKLNEVPTADLDKIKSQMKANYMTLGLSEAEATLAADLDLGSKIY